jgi:hypothetical protein
LPGSGWLSWRPTIGSRSPRWAASSPSSIRGPSLSAASAPVRLLSGCARPGAF